MSVSRRRRMIDCNHEKLNIGKQCKLLKISRSSWYYKDKGESEFNLVLMREIDKIFMEYPFFGVRQMRRYLVNHGYAAGIKRVRRLMRLLGLMAIYQKPRTTVADPLHKRFPYLLKGFDINRVNKVWCADITYIPMHKGFLYLVAIMDWHSRKVMSWRLSSNMEVDFCVSALEEALAKYGKPEIFNTDQGSQFTSAAFIGVLRERGIRISLDGRGRCMDNIFIERLWRSLKYEEVYIKAYEDGKEAKEGISKWMKFYNTKRPHSSLGGVPPDEFYKEMLRDAA